MSAALEALRALDPDRDWETFMAAMRVKCPWCKARSYQSCHVDGMPLREGTKIHPARAARGAEEAEA